MQGLHGLQGLHAAAQGLHGLQAAAHGLHGLQAAAQGLHGLQAAAQGLHGLQAAAHGLQEAARSSGASIASTFDVPAATTTDVVPMVARQLTIATQSGFLTASRVIFEFIKISFVFIDIAKRVMRSNRHH